MRPSIERFTRRGAKLMTSVDILVEALPCVSDEALVSSLARLRVFKRGCYSITDTRRRHDVQERTMATSLVKLCDRAIKKLNKARQDIKEGKKKLDAREKLKRGPQLPYGRKRLHVPIKVQRVIRALRADGASWPVIVKATGLSKSTLKRLPGLQNLANIGPRAWSAISEVRLTRLLNNWSEKNPYSGWRMALGHIRSQGLKVPRDKVRDILRKTNPDASAFRALHTVKRRVYSVRGSNALWHHDANMKLERWGFVLHGCVDGYSRLIVYLRCTNNKRSETVLSYFKDAVSSYGLPSRVRGDCGKESKGVEDYMVEMRGADHQPYLKGRSIHNVRIERSWRDVWKDVSRHFHRLFRHMVKRGYLVQTSRFHLAILHLIFKTRIQLACDAFIRSWNAHPLSSEQGKSPLVLWKASRIEAQLQGWSEDPGDSILVTAQGDYGLDTLQEGEGDIESENEEDSGGGLGRGCPTDFELARARRLLRGFEDDIEGDKKGKVTFRRAIAHAESALRAL